jgi:hypothetical protein
MPESAGITEKHHERDADTGFEVSLKRLGGTNGPEAWQEILELYAVAETSLIHARLNISHLQTRHISRIVRLFFVMHNVHPIFIA